MINRMKEKVTMLPAHTHKWQSA